MGPKDLKLSPCNLFFFFLMKISLKHTQNMVPNIRSCPITKQQGAFMQFLLSSKFYLLGSNWDFGLLFCHASTESPSSSCLCLHNTLFTLYKSPKVSKFAPFIYISEVQAWSGSLLRILYSFNQGVNCAMFLYGGSEEESFLHLFRLLACSFRSEVSGSLLTACHRLHTNLSDVPHSLPCGQQ